MPYGLCTDQRVVFVFAFAFVFVFVFMFGDARNQRGGRLQVGFGFGQIYAPFLARYTPRFWLKYTPKRRFWKTRRLLRGVFLRASITRRIFLWICAVQWGVRGALHFF